MPVGKLDQAAGGVEARGVVLASEETPPCSAADLLQAQVETLGNEVGARRVVFVPGRRRLDVLRQEAPNVAQTVEVLDLTAARELPQMREQRRRPAGRPEGAVAERSRAIGAIERERQGAAGHEVIGGGYQQVAAGEHRRDPGLARIPESRSIGGLGERYLN